MQTHYILKLSLISLLYSNLILAKTNISTDEKIDGTYHLRILDGMDVRKARVILDIDTNIMRLSGFDGCHSISADLTADINKTMSISQVKSMEMVCRTPLHKWTKDRVIATLLDKVNIIIDKKNGVSGITIKSLKHELFLGDMGK